VVAAVVSTETRCLSRVAAYGNWSWVEAHIHTLVEPNIGAGATWSNVNRAERAAPHAAACVLTHIARLVGIVTSIKGAAHVKTWANIARVELNVADISRASVVRTAHIT
jgi:hypothetical protein